MNLSTQLSTKISEIHANLLAGREESYEARLGRAVLDLFRSSKTTSQNNSDFFEMFIQHIKSGRGSEFDELYQEQPMVADEWLKSRHIDHKRTVGHVNYSFGGESMTRIIHEFRVPFAVDENPDEFQQGLNEFFEVYREEVKAIAEYEKVLETVLLKMLGRVEPDLVPKDYADAGSIKCICKRERDFGAIYEQDEKLTTQWLEARGIKCESLSDLYSNYKLLIVRENGFRSEVLEAKITDMFDKATAKTDHSQVFENRIQKVFLDILKIDRCKLSGDLTGFSLEASVFQNDKWQDNIESVFRDYPGVADDWLIARGIKYTRTVNSEIKKLVDYVFVVSHDFYEGSDEVQIAIQKIFETLLAEANKKAELAKTLTDHGRRLEQAFLEMLEEVKPSLEDSSITLVKSFSSLRGDGLDFDRVYQENSIHARHWLNSHGINYSEDGNQWLRRYTFRIPC